MGEEGVASARNAGQQGDKERSGPGMTDQKSTVQTGSAHDDISSGDRCALVLKVQGLESFQDTFGSTVSSLARDDLTRGFSDMAHHLLEQYHIQSDVISPEHDTWYVLFSPKKTEPPRDMSEQMKALTAAGTHYARSMLQQGFGSSIGGWMDFTLIVVPVPAGLSRLTLHAYLNEALRRCPSAGRQHATVSKGDLRSIIDNADFDIYLHPIISLTDDTVAGYEALTRGPLESPVFAAPDLFNSASYYGFQEKLELACITKVLDQGMNLMEPYWITINVSPNVLTGPDFLNLINQPRLRDMLHRIIFEITEHVPIQVTEGLIRTAHHLKDRGIDLALDDTGCGYAHLETVSDIPFKIVKLCITVTSRIGRHPDIIEDISRTVERIRTRGGVVLSEGVERREQIDILKKTGVSLAQGFYYGQPRHIDQVLQG